MQKTGHLLYQRKYKVGGAFFPIPRKMTMWASFKGILIGKMVEEMNTSQQILQPQFSSGASTTAFIHKNCKSVNLNV